MIQYFNKNPVLPHVLTTSTDQDVVVMLCGGYLLPPSTKMNIQFPSTSLGGSRSYKVNNWLELVIAAMAEPFVCDACC